MFYCEAFQVSDGYRGRVYKYKEDGNRTEVVQFPPEVFSSKEEAIDHVVQWCEDNNFECEIDFN